MMVENTCDTLVIGAGIIGISVAHYLKRLDPTRSVVLADSAPPMSLTSAQSGENYRNWWPHPVMTAFTDRSITLMEEIAAASDDVFQMTRRGYALATRSPDIEPLLKDLERGYSGSPDADIRIHERPAAATYSPAHSADWRSAPDGVDVLNDPTLIAGHFPSFDPEIRTVIHVRRAGAISSQQLGQWMLDRFRNAGGHRVSSEITEVSSKSPFDISLKSDGQVKLSAQSLVIAAGPFIERIAEWLGHTLPVKNILQQKIAFEDTARAIPRRLPFSIDLDGQLIDWSDEERALMGGDPAMARYCSPMPGAIHCRPDGGDGGNWVRLGWAYNSVSSKPQREPSLSDEFPEIVLRGAARLNPGLKAYYGRLPRNRHHYGGFYTMTEENWPLIGPLGTDGAFIAGAFSGFGTMAACAAGELCAKWVIGASLPDYARALSPDRYEDPDLMSDLTSSANRGIL